MVNRSVAKRAKHAKPALRKGYLGEVEFLRARRGPCRQPRARRSGSGR